MSKHCFKVVLLWCIALCQIAFGEEFSNVDVSAQIDPYHTFINHPIQGTITITHNVKSKVDPDSFKMEGSSLKVEAIKEVPMPSTPNIVLSIYQFELPGKPQGLYPLPAISVKVGDSTYWSIPSTYEISGAAPKAPTTPAVKASLLLKQTIDAPPMIYPGHIIKFTYFYYYTGDIELTTEVLPLLDAKGFTKVGEKQVKDYLQGNISVREVSQLVKAVKPGEYVIPPASVEGYAYVEEGLLKKRVYLQPKIQSETSEVTLKVNAFPEKGKPASFNGSVGEFTFQVSLLTNPTVNVEEKMQIALDISGVADLVDVPLPALTSLKSLFRLSDLPPVGQINNSTERFIIDIYPLSTAIKEIPAIEFSYFEPISGIYVTLNSLPIPITVLPRSTPAPAPSPPPPPQNKQPIPPPAVEQPPPLPPESSSPTSPSEESKVQPTEAVEISSIYAITQSDLDDLSAGTWEVILLIPLGALLIMVLLWYRSYLKTKAQIVKPITSDEVFRDAMKAPFASGEFFRQLNHAFMLRLYERGDIPSTEIVPEQIPAAGLPGEVRTFLYNLEEKRFAGTGSLAQTEVIPAARELFDKLS